MLSFEVFISWFVGPYEQCFRQLACLECNEELLQVLFPLMILRVDFAGVDENGSGNFGAENPWMTLEWKFQLAAIKLR